jgi:hypothetical protein
VVHLELLQVQLQEVVEQVAAVPVQLQEALMEQQEQLILVVAVEAVENVILLQV